MNKQELESQLFYGLRNTENFKNKSFRWDIHPNSDFLNIIFLGGTFGNFLRYFIDKFCSLTPDILEEPFTDIGTSHAKVNYSGKVLRYHPSFVNDNKEKTDLPICQIIPTTELGYLYLKDAQWYRAGDDKISINDIWTKNKEEITYDGFINLLKSIENLYNIENVKTIPKWIVRDIFKLEFLDLNKSTHPKIFNYFKNHPFFKKQKTFHFPLESFFDYNEFIASLKKLNQYHNLEIDFTRDEEMKYIFNKGFNLDKLRIQIKTTKKILDALDEREETEIPELSVAHEGFIYAQTEKKNKLVRMPFYLKGFFKNTREIYDYIDTYPNHYHVKDR